MKLQQSSETARQKQARKVLAACQQAMPAVQCSLHFATAWQLLLAAILSAQCTDERVNLCTAPLFARYPAVEDYPPLGVAGLEPYIRSCGLYHSKAAHIIAAARMLLTEWQGQVPEAMEDLLRLPGVGRKIANLIRSEWFHLPGLVVDTHCKRLSRLLGLTQENTPEKIEADLCQIIPADSWTVYGHYCVELGRSTCQARCRHCGRCPLQHCCAYAAALSPGLSERDPEEAANACF